MDKKMKRDYAATKEGREYLRLLTDNANEENKIYSPMFSDMVDAYRAMFIYGLTKGKRLKSEKGFIGIGQFTMLMGVYDFSSLLESFGKSNDLEDIGGSINEYTNWAIEDVRKKFPDGKITVKKLRKLFE